MKIGILTQPLQYNYGGILQAFALQHVLCELGHEAIVINISRIEDYNTVSNVIDRINIIARGIVKYIMRKTDYVKFKTCWYEIVRQNIDPFVDNYIKKTQLITSPKQLSKISKEEKFDAIIVGSDQVWRPIYSPKIENYFLDFCQNDNIKRYSYAASFGVDEWEFNEKQTLRCKELLKAFNGVSVRESSAVDLCKKYFHHNACQVLDPTLLVDRTVYQKMTQVSDVKDRDGDLFTYILDDYLDLSAIIGHVERVYHLRSFKTMPSMQLHNLKNKKDLSKCIYPSVESWIRSFLDAKFVITDSFHGCVFSIIFNKPFIALGNPERGQSRFKSLLSLFELEDRLCKSLDEVIKVSKIKINWEKVNSILELEKEKSYVFFHQITSVK